ncbi:hypothetical protein LTR56_015719 [Elasticomyces elasticus]|nr:hypothetical protein LTR56_015719 [Elasticomyces elasticus]KAK3659250.1 hypothetical protein LTR22_008517 [Elasticomyces elasticus]KAK4914776.1 hypothetical protein LTR49_017011 [Elasticomyces elasticus]KAK5754246.1 hypothetical protein LTS12_015656 [Elasticomyces elasticus]
MPTLDPIVDAQVSLRARIDTAMKPWSKTRDAPPFNCTQLIVMALLMADQPLTPKDVWMWIATSFPYYQLLAAESYWDFTDRDPAQSTRTLRFRTSLQQAFMEYDLPLLTSRTGSSTSIGKALYSVAPLIAEAWLDLPEDIAVSDKTTFPFFELPRELRDAIYTMVFQYPRSGIYLQTRGDPRVKSRDPDHRCSYDPYAWIAGGIFSLKKMPNTLSPFLTNRQFYNEAMPIFFDINTFCFRSQSHMSRRVMALSELQRKYIRSIGFQYERVGNERHFEALAALPNLRRLALGFDKRTAGEWHSMGWAHSWARTRSMQIIRGMESL